MRRLGLAGMPSPGSRRFPHPKVDFAQESAVRRPDLAARPSREEVMKDLTLSLIPAARRLLGLAP
jgi:hypothetical protein